MRGLGAGPLRGLRETPKSELWGCRVTPLETRTARVGASNRRGTAGDVPHSPRRYHVQINPATLLLLICMKGPTPVGQAVTNNPQAAASRSEADTEHHGATRNYQSEGTASS